MVLTRRDGAEFRLWIGVRKERGFAPVTDERPLHRRNSARREAVALSRPSDVVVPLARATGPRCASLLADERLRAITAGQNHVIML